MSVSNSVPTWEILKAFGFQPDTAVVSDIQPGLSYDFGNFTLSVSAVINLRFAEVIMCSGVLSTRRTLSEVHIEMPRQMESREQCAAWLAWSLDRQAGRLFQPQRKVDWLEIGRANESLLPWVRDRAAYEARPHCSMEREWARLAIKQLKAALLRVPADSEVWFAFDGEVLRIRCGEDVIAAAATGKAWPERYALKANQLKTLPGRLMHLSVEFSAWKGSFHIANRQYEGVVSSSIQP